MPAEDTRSREEEGGIIVCNNCVFGKGSLRQERKKKALSFVLTLVMSPSSVCVILMMEETLEIHFLL